MKSEFQFFMASQDQDEFLEFSGIYIDEIDKSQNTYWKFIIGDCFMQFIPCRIHEGDLISDRIAIQTHGLDKELTCTNAGKAERICKNLREWLKKSYTNKLTCRNLHRPECVHSSKSMWIGPNARKWEQKSNGFLKQIPGGFVVFELNENT